jgi:hypothetical protein
MLSIWKTDILTLNYTRKFPLRGIEPLNSMTTLYPVHIGSNHRHLCVLYIPSLPLSVATDLIRYSIQHINSCWPIKICEGQGGEGSSHNRIGAKQPKEVIILCVTTMSLAPNLSIGFLSSHYYYTTMLSDKQINHHPSHVLLHHKNQ